MNNNVFGKIMENIHKYCEIRKQMAGAIRCKKFDLSVLLSQLHYFKTDLVFNKTLFMGMPILDLLKIVMYRFLYEYLIPNLSQGSIIKVLYMNTDRFIIEVIVAMFMRVQTWIRIIWKKIYAVKNYITFFEYKSGVVKQLKTYA